MSAPQLLTDVFQGQEIECHELGPPAAAAAKGRPRPGSVRVDRVAVRVDSAGAGVRLRRSREEGMTETVCGAAGWSWNRKTLL